MRENNIIQINRIIELWNFGVVYYKNLSGLNYFCFTILQDTLGVIFRFFPICFELRISQIQIFRILGVVRVFYFPFFV